MALSAPPPSWVTIKNKPTTVAGLGLSDFNASAISAQAGASVGGVGTYAFLVETSTTETAAGGTRAGSVLRYGGGASDMSGNNSTMGAPVLTGNGGTPAGTWRAMGRVGSNSPGGYYCGGSVWIRIS